MWIMENNSFVVFYDKVWNIRDQRVDDWFMMSSILPTILLCFFYFVCSIFVGPWLMKNREPLELKTLMQIYNLGKFLY